MYNICSCPSVIPSKLERFLFFTSEILLNLLQSISLILLLWISILYLSDIYSDNCLYVKYGNWVYNLYNSAKNVLNNVGNWIGGLFGRGEYVGKGKEVKEPKEIEITGDAPNATPSGNNNFPYFSQYGEYTDDKQKPDLAKSGCGPTSAAMVLSKVKNQIHLQ